ncbi:hypothetical protein BH09ACT12_BH09ACT12_16030 [soil metagenome]
MHNACMTTITIRDVPEETRDLLAARAKRAGQSMQEYLRRRLIELGEAEVGDEWLERARESVDRWGTRLPTEQILEALHDGRR